MTNIPFITANEVQERTERAVNNFKAGYNCSQSVVAAYADLFGLKAEQALLVSASFGGGIGRMRQTCGAACGMFLLAGLATGTTDAADRAGKSNNYKVVQQLASLFKEENGSLICAELLGLKKSEISCEASPRTEVYYKKRPCAMMVETGAKLFGEYLLSQQAAEENQ